MIDFSNFYKIITKHRLSFWLETLPAQLAIWQNKALCKKFKQWEHTVKLLPEITPYKLDLLNSITAQSKSPLTNNQKLHITELMRHLIPWKKGPFSLYDIYIDAEWRSDWKWQRMLPYLSNLHDRIILDVGCGNGYHLWRMIGAGARLAVGIDPSRLFLYQFEAIRKLLGNNQHVHLLPLKIQQLPKLNAFDSVFSMGVLYHRISPLEHIWQLKNQLVNGGELVVETLVIEGDEHTVFTAVDRYAQMRNVYFIPSTLSLKKWLMKCGFIDIRIVNTCITTIQEQRRTEWMTNNSLAEFLNPNDRTQTIEGYPAPMRAVLIAKKP